MLSNRRKTALSLVLSFALTLATPVLAADGTSGDTSLISQAWSWVVGLFCESGDNGDIVP